MLEELSFPPLSLEYWHILGAALLTYSHVCPNTQTTLGEVRLPLTIWKFAHAYCLHCAVQCHYSFFSFMPDSCYPLLISCGPHNKEQKKALTKKKETKPQQQQTLTNALTFLFFFLI